MSRQREITVIANPASGRGCGRERAQALLAALEAAGFAPSPCWTQGRGHARELVRQALAQGVRQVVVLGGDGTMQEAAGALAGSACVLARALLAGQGRTVDLGRVNGSYYCTVGAVGFDAAVTRYVDRMSLPLIGTPASLYAVLRMLKIYQPPQVRVLWEGGQYEGPLFLAAIGNTATYGNGMPIVPMAQPHDGWLDLCLIRPAGFWRVVGLLPAMLRGKHGRAREVSFARTRRVEIHCEQGVEMWADGEPLAQTETLVIEAAPGALTVLDPQAA